MPSDMKYLTLGLKSKTIYLNFTLILSERRMTSPAPDREPQQEVEAFNSLQSKYFTLEWELQNDLKSWLYDAEIKLKTCETIRYLENVFQSLIVEHSMHLTGEAEKVETCLTDYFKKSNLQGNIPSGAVQAEPTRLYS